jgi:hypothetical protein
MHARRQQLAHEQVLVLEVVVSLSETLALEGPLQERIMVVGDRPVFNGVRHD